MSNLRAAPLALDPVRVGRLLALIRGEAANATAAQPRLRLGSPDTSRRPLRIIGVQNGAPAIDFLRRSGVSVKAVAGPVGTLWLMSGQAVPLDLAKVVSIAVQRGFEG